ncbi:hypothetical protein CL622_03465 [archaeon]|nr:hypothetical protein [archaeon]|tara:strand:+ start:2039 stop:3202 length:1164 start_codon:yes stop_codon:yes gene_type:complete
MNWDLILLLAFWAILLIIIYTHKSKFEIQGKVIALYRTALGLKAMRFVADRFPRTLRVLGYIGVVAGFLGMVVMLGFLVYGTWQLIFVPSAQPVLSPVLPGVAIPGLPRLSFFHWIITIFIVAAVHEFAHGVLSFVHKIHVKSSGFALFGPILAAFVEPDEQALDKAPKRASLSVLAAGAFANFLLTIPFLLLFAFVMNPVAAQLYMVPDGIIVQNVTVGGPLDGQLQVGERLMQVNGQDLVSIQDFLGALDGLKPGDTVALVTDKSAFNIIASQHPDFPEKGYLGVVISQSITSTRPAWETSAFLWVSLLVFWVYAVSLGIGLFNLLPLGPIDGGRMLYIVLLSFLPEKKAKKIWGWVSYLVLALIIINLLPFLYKLVLYIASFFV